MAQNSSSLMILKQYLTKSPKEELIVDIIELFKKFDSVKDYYQVKLSPQEETQIAAKYKKIIEDGFFSARGLGKYKLSAAKKAITEYRKIADTQVGSADIMLFYVEQGVKFTNTYWDIDERFYNSMESMYEKAVKWIVKYKIQDSFKDRCKRIVKDTSGIGWGFHDTLSDIYSGAFNDE